MNILIVDDEAAVRRVIRENLSSKFAGADFFEAEDGKLALQLCEIEKFDLMITDYRMPRVNGGELIRTLRVGSTFNNCVPVIVTSAFVPEAQEDVKNFENVIFLDKPIDFTKLTRFTKWILRSSGKLAA